jgi:hypothetical protein
MDFYWVYDLPNWEFAVITVALFVFMAVAGLLVFRKHIKKSETPGEHNDLVSFFMAGVNAMYGITLGLIAVGVWQNFTDVDNTVSKEAASLSALYQDINAVPPPLGDSLRACVKEYVRYTIEDAWPEQKKGLLPHGGTSRLTRFQKTLQLFEPTSKAQEIALAEVYHQFNQVIQWRRQRLQSVNNGLPAAIWYVIFFGAFLNIVITWFFNTHQFRTLIWMTAIFAALLGSLVFLIAAMDNPFRGEFSVSTDAFELIFKQMKR